MSDPTNMDWTAMVTALRAKGEGVRLLVGACLLVVAVLPSVAQECAGEVFRYRQDADQATGWNQVLPVAPADAAVADFTDRPFLDLTINGETTRYTTTSGGTGITSRAAYIPSDEEAKSFAYNFFSLSGRVGEGQPDHFLILDGELYWPECP